MTSPFDHPIAQGWSKPSIQRVQAARTDYQRWNEAGRATLEAVVRYLVRRGWQRRHTSNSTGDQRADSRYLCAPDRPNYKIRLSNHALPNRRYHGQNEYIITYDVMTTHTVLGIVQWIENDLNAVPKIQTPKIHRPKPKASEVTKHDIERWYEDKAAYLD